MLSRPEPFEKQGIIKAAFTRIGTPVALVVAAILLFVPSLAVEWDRTYPRGATPPWFFTRLRDAMSPNLFGVLCAIGVLAIYVFAITPIRQRDQAWSHIDNLDALLDERPNLFVVAGNDAEFQVLGLEPLPDEVAAQVGSAQVRYAYLSQGNWHTRATLLRVENRSIDVEAREVMAKVLDVKGDAAVARGHDPQLSLLGPDRIPPGGKTYVVLMREWIMGPPENERTRLWESPGRWWRTKDLSPVEVFIETWCPGNIGGRVVTRLLITFPSGDLFPNVLELPIETADGCGGAHGAKEAKGRTRTRRGQKAHRETRQA